MNLSRQKVLAPKPPEKGSFPLDHFDECGPVMREYLDCLERHDNAGSYCQQDAQKYLRCRMERGLMLEEPLENLGFQNPIDRSPQS